MFNLLKKSFALLLVVAMLFTLGACKDKNGDKNDGTSGGQTIQLDAYDLDSEAIINSMPAELKGTKIKFLNWYDPMQREEKAVIEAFEQKTGCDVEIIVKTYGPEYNAALASFVATGDSPDVIRMLSPKVANLKSLQPISVTGFDFSDKAWDKNTETRYTVDGVTYGVNLRYSPFFLPAVLFYNKETIEEYDFEDPYELWKQDKWTWDKLVEMCEEFVKVKPEHHGLAMLPYGDLPAMTAGLDWMKYDGKQYSVDLADAKILEKWQFALENKKARVFTESQDGFDTANQKTLFAAMDATAVQTSSQYYSKTRRRGKLMGVPAPTWGSKADYSVPLIEDLAFGVPIDAPNPKAVPYFLAYYLDFSNYDTEGTNFFFSEQIKEMYMDLLTVEKRSFNTSQHLMGAQGGYSNVSIYRNVDPAQLTIWLQEREYIINDTVAQLNDTLTKLEKPKK
ncbi:MAG: ABC transporter substrate-binding protein [Acutalibacteraceae bacterium]|nr:ABC transporter substrate-binding protein [Acutalibacteraceae bacterium]